MNRLKSWLSLSLVLILLLGFSACGETEGVPSTQTTASTNSVSIQNTDQNTEPEPILYENPLTGIDVEYDNAGKRPVAIMLNNIKQALPQEGISAVDVLIECPVEGGITRLMGLVSDYASMEEIGSIRSSRPYYLDFAQAFDAIYCHAGGSNQAYSQIASRKINNIDGVKKDPLDVYYRDQERLKTMDLEHTMMTTGEGIVKSIAHFNYRTELRSDFKLPYSFPTGKEPISVGAEDALHVYIPVTGYQKVDYVYDAETKAYLRYQHNGNKHVDGNNDQQLSFTNVIVLFCKTTVIDSYGLLEITNVGSGSGYLISGGKYTAVTWTRESRDGNLTLTETETGNPLVINRGKTAVNVCPLDVKKQINLNATDRTVAQ